MKQLFIDIETIPNNIESKPDIESLEFYIEAQEPTIPANYKSEASIQNWKQKKYPELKTKSELKAKEQSQKLYDDSYKKWAKQSFDQINCRIITISLAIDDDKPTTIAGTEKDIIDNFFIISEIERKAYQWIAFNAIFDLSILATKTLKYLGPKEASLIPWNFSPYQQMPVFDPMLNFPHQSRKYHSQDKIAKYFDIESKTTMSGSDVLPYYLDNKQQLINEYCEEDVQVLRQITRRMGV